MYVRPHCYVDNSGDVRIQDVRYVGKTFYNIVSQPVGPVTEARRADPLPSPS